MMSGNVTPHISSSWVLIIINCSKANHTRGSDLLPQR